MKTYIMHEIKKKKKVFARFLFTVYILISARTNFLKKTFRDVVESKLY